MNTLNVAVAIARGIHGAQVDVGIKERLHVVIAGRKRIQTLDWKCCSRLVDVGDSSRPEILDVASEDRRRIHTGFADPVSRLRPVRLRNNDEETSRSRRKTRRNFKLKTPGAGDDQQQESTKSTPEGHFPTG